MYRYENLFVGELALIRSSTQGSQTAKVAVSQETEEARKHHVSCFIEFHDMGQRPQKIGALILTYTILGVRYYSNSIMGTKPYSNS